MQYTEETNTHFKLESPLNINNNETNKYTYNNGKKLTKYLFWFKIPDCNKLYVFENGKFKFSFAVINAFFA